MIYRELQGGAARWAGERSRSRRLAGASREGGQAGAGRAFGARSAKRMRRALTRSSRLCQIVT